MVKLVILEKYGSICEVKKAFPEIKQINDFEMFEHLHILWDISDYYRCNNGCIYYSHTTDDGLKLFTKLDGIDNVSDLIAKVEIIENDVFISEYKYPNERFTRKLLASTNHFYTT